MASLIPDPSLLLYGSIGFVILVFILAAYLFLKKRNYGERNTSAKAERLAYQPESRMIPVVPPKTIPRPVQKTPPAQKPKEINLLNGRDNIAESLQALTERYSLDQFTIATTDGLVFASSGGESAQMDAATCSESLASNPQPILPGITLGKVSHKGSDLILIIRTPLAVPREIIQDIENDTKDILNWWI